jgi:DNA uptake protein ComE-like DNA-binding protein
LQAAETALKLDPQVPQNEIRQDSVKQEKKSASKQGNEKTVPRLQRSSTPLLNTVFFHETDSVLLQMVAGIGPVLSGRIIKFRELIGGFHQPEQILEVYGLSAEVAERVYTTFPFKAEITKKVRINEVDAKQLSEHPYISAAEAKVIIAYRNQHGPFQNTADLLKIKIFNENWVKRIEPYVTW